jgi:hypothetical protein
MFGDRLMRPVGSNPVYSGALSGVARLSSGASLCSSLSASTHLAVPVVSDFTASVTRGTRLTALLAMVLRLGSFRAVAAFVIWLFDGFPWAAPASVALEEPFIIDLEVVNKRS